MDTFIRIIQAYHMGIRAKVPLRVEALAREALGDCGFTEEEASATIAFVGSQSDFKAVGGIGGNAGNKLALAVPLYVSFRVRRCDHL